MNDLFTSCRLSRRSAVLAALGALSAASMPGTRLVHAQGTPIAVETTPELVIDLSGEPVSIDPAVAYAPLDWSIVHSIYDALVGFDAEGQIRPIAAERFEQTDEVTFEATLRQGMTFHDGSPVTADAVIRGFDHVRQGESLVADLFSTISDVIRVDDLTVHIVCDQPSPWLPAQMAAWHVLLPEGFTEQSLSQAPVGSGPYRYATWVRGNEIVLERFEDYQPVSIKGAPIADVVRYHFVPDATTRLSNFISGSTHLVTDVPFDMLNALSAAGANVISQPLVGSAWVRIATDTEPFNDVRVRRALNHALDLDAISGALIYEESRRLASIHPGPESLGHDPSLEPYEHDPDTARELLEDAGYGDGIEGVLQITPGTQQSVAEALVAQWDEVGIQIEIEVADYASFNADWSDPAAPALKLATWSPLYDPHTLLSLVWAGDGVLSRYDNPDVTQLIHNAAVEADSDRRGELYQEISRLMHEDAAGVWLWNLVAVYGKSNDVPVWSPRPDEWVLPLFRG